MGLARDGNVRATHGVGMNNLERREWEWEDISTDFYKTVATCYDVDQ